MAVSHKVLFSYSDLPSLPNEEITLVAYKFDVGESGHCKVLYQLRKLRWDLENDRGVETMDLDATDLKDLITPANFIPFSLPKTRLCISKFNKEEPKEGGVSCVDLCEPRHAPNKVFRLSTRTFIELQRLIPCLLEIISLHENQDVESRMVYLVTTLMIAESAILVQDEGTDESDYSFTNNQLEEFRSIVQLRIEGGKFLKALDIPEYELDSLPLRLSKAKVLASTVGIFTEVTEKVLAFISETQP